MLIILIICFVIFISILILIFKIPKPSNDSKTFTKLHNQLLEKYKNKYINDKICNIPIYYINLSKSSFRKNYIENQAKIFNLKLTRIEGIDSSDLNLSNGSIYLNNNTSIEYNNYYKLQTLNELGCTLSHIKAIYTAYKNGDNNALIIEDDVSFGLYPLWKNNLNDIMKEAPTDWNTINLSSYYFGTQKSNNPYVKYYKFPLQSYAYLINRKGMENVIYDVLKNNQIILGFNNIRDGNSLLADMLLFYRSGNSYIYTKFPLFYPYNNHNEMNSTINTDYTNIHIKTYLNILKNQKY
jgi:GR25 family glycosyltransferase involved in LPS biosynthesis